MKPILEYIISKSTKRYTIKADNDNIKRIIENELDRLGSDADLNHIDVSKVTSFISLFIFINPEKYKYFEKIDISNWNVSNAEYMSYMFQGCKYFNCDISRWDVSNVKDMICMFDSCTLFNQDISGWDMRNVQNISSMFSQCITFDKPIGKWNLESLIRAHGTFSHCTNFNQDLSNWSKYVKHLENTAEMFCMCEDLNQDFSSWDLSYLSENDRKDMFKGCKRMMHHNLPKFN